eukprot:63752_1
MDRPNYLFTHVHTQTADDHGSFSIITPELSKPQPKFTETSTYQDMGDYLLSRSAMLLKRHHHDTMECDFSPPYPWLAEHCPYPCFCCCVIPRAVRQQFALSVLYSRCYLIVYLIIIGITVTLFIYALAHTEGDVLNSFAYETKWLIWVDVSCVVLMILDVAIQIQAHHHSYWKSAMNLFDLTVVVLCITYLPVYFHLLDHGPMLSILLSIRFIASFLRIVMVYKHQMDRKAFMEAAEGDVTFEGYQSGYASYVISKTQSLLSYNKV